MNDLSELAVLAAVGFVAQLVDGALGMAYGVVCSSLLLTSGYSPAAASASVHLAEVLTSGVSGHFHWRLGNVDPRLFKSLLWPGIIGGVIGALAVTMAPADALRPWVAIYLAAMGVRILYRANRIQAVPAPSRHRTELLGFFGGLLDSAGGGGWGPIVTTTLVGQGHEPRLAIGSVNRAEFFVTVAASITFLATIEITDWRSIAALAAGGALAAPFSARLATTVSRKLLMRLVGLMILALSLRTLLLAIW